MKTIYIEPNERGVALCERFRFDGVAHRRRHLPALLRHRTGPAHVVNFDDVVTCLPVVQEALPRRGPSECNRLLPVRPAHGAHGSLSSVDCLIAACAIRHDIEDTQEVTLKKMKRFSIA